MKNLFFSIAIATSFCSAVAQVPLLKAPPVGGNKKASVSEQIGITDVTIHYIRPGVKGREGEIYGSLVHKGFQDPGFGTSKAAPWRAGANENTTIEFSSPVKIEGKDLPAGKYGFFVAYDPAECTVIFSKTNSAWGSYFYNESEDALRVNVKPVALDKSVEWLKYEFINETENSATIALQWEKLMIPFKVEVDVVQTSLTSFRQELKSEKGFRPDSWQQAAAMCLNNSTNLEEGLAWSDNAVAYDRNFQTLSTNAGLLEKLGRKAKSDSVMRVAMGMGSMMELHQYGRQLLSQKKAKEALEVFQLNAKKNPKQFTTYAGLARGYSAVGDYKTALNNAKAALPLAPNEVNKSSVEDMIRKLEKGTDVN
ncbi:MAG: DUF2911 domain-containing protein [Bacteroidia bacterium]